MMVRARAMALYKGVSPPGVSLFIALETSSLLSGNVENQISPSSLSKKFTPELEKGKNANLLGFPSVVESSEFDKSLKKRLTASLTTSSFVRFSPFSSSISVGSLIDPLVSINTIISALVLLGFAEYMLARFSSFLYFSTIEKLSGSSTVIGLRLFSAMELITVLKITSPCVVTDIWVLENARSGTTSGEDVGTIRVGSIGEGSVEVGKGN